MTAANPNYLGYWRSETDNRDKCFVSLEEAMLCIDQHLFVLEDNGALKYAVGGSITDDSEGSLPVRGCCTGFFIVTIGRQAFLRRSWAALIPVTRAAWPTALPRWIW